MIKILQILALTVGICTYLFWNDLKQSFQIPVFYIGNALFIFLLCVLNYILSDKNVICFLLICLSFSNLLDEIFFDNTKISFNEIILALILPSIWFIIRRKNAGKNNTK